jgi:hypothetical protein
MCSVTAQGSAEARFWRGIATGRPAIAQSIAFELPQVRVEHALALVLLVRDVEHDHYPRFAERLVAKLRADTRVAEWEAALAAAALDVVGGAAPEVGARALLGLLEALGERRAMQVLEDWLAR